MVVRCSEKDQVLDKRANTLRREHALQGKGVERGIVLEPCTRTTTGTIPLPLGSTNLPTSFTPLLRKVTIERHTVATASVAFQNGGQYTQPLLTKVAGQIAGHFSKIRAHHDTEAQSVLW